MLFLWYLLWLTAVSSNPVVDFYDNYLCPQPSGLFPNPRNCAKFYDCTNSIPHTKHCGKGTYYDENRQICDFLENADCGDRPVDGQVPVAPAEAPVTPTGGHIVTKSTTQKTTAPTTIAPTVAPSSVSPLFQPGTSTVTHRFPKRVMGLYILLADDDNEGFENNSDSWTPELYPWQQKAANVLFFTFIHPGTMEVPPSFRKLAATRGTKTPGAVPADTVILFAIGGYAYSLKPNPWHWLTSRQAAEAMAVKVATWPSTYGIDGIDLDIEEGAGSNKIAGPNLVHFIRKLRSIVPDIIIGQPTYGFPQVQAESDVINASWNPDGSSNNLADAIGLMVYEGTQSLNYISNYINGSSKWEQFPIKTNVPSNVVLLGCKGQASANTIATLGKEAKKQDLLGIMVWYASVKNGFHYAVTWDASTSQASIDAFKTVGADFKAISKISPPSIEEKSTTLKNHQVTTSKTTTKKISTTEPTTQTTTKPTTIATKVTTTTTTTVPAISSTTLGASVQGGTFTVSKQLPNRVMGLYILLADDDHEGFESSSSTWTPELHPWQQEAANVLFFTFIHPGTMDVPPSFQKLAATRGTNSPGAIPAETVILFAIGGYAYSLRPNPWHWLTSRQAAEDMAVKVATWPQKYGIDGIDLDIEEGAGSNNIAGPNLVHFIRKLRTIVPNIIIGQPTYGFPQVQAETDVINASWNPDGTSNNLADAIGLMVYEGTQSLNYISNFINGTSKWEQFPIKTNVPSNVVLLGCKGQASASTILTLGKETKNKNLLGIMVWYASVKNGFQYSVTWDASTSLKSIEAFKTVGQNFKSLNLRGF